MANAEFEEYLRRVIVSGDITERSAISFLKQISILEHIDPTKEIVVYIDTYGGNADAAIMMHDAIKICKCPITTIGLGKVMSAGVLILSAGDEGSRFVTPNARIMMHQLSGGSYGTTKDLDVFTNEIKRQQNVFYDLVAFYSKNDKNQLLNNIMHDRYLSAEEAVEYGLADFVLPYASEKNAPKKAGNKKAKAVKKKKR